ncbi:hypothetical protein OHQ89_34970 [Streptomyces canus]
MTLIDSDEKTGQMPNVANSRTKGEQKAQATSVRRSRPEPRLDR